MKKIIGLAEKLGHTLEEKKREFALKKPDKDASLPSRAHALQIELAHKIASFTSFEENRATGIPGVTLHRRIAPTAPCTMAKKKPA